MENNKESVDLVPAGFSNAIKSVREQGSNVIGSQVDTLIVKPENIKWVNAPRGMPPGSLAAVIEGDPKISGFFTLRHKIPSNWKVMPHTHSADEHITVLKGSCYLGKGEKYEEETATKLIAGTFTVMKAGTPHYFFTKKPCVIQVHGIGPQSIKYINSEDDPRMKNKSLFRD